ncbi:hypothetical protein K469DRAFT_319739 [Zopfia rhizophila CBS 207.26]|uniref:Uncharacterized protein n=1 Tax=Zopfia rhizophila CBS 207.26 TaxID=1314779 RepID=A0A6A6ESD5_9PEZI|nr:hypothetical protein K469DRAFT_319739 [Zopfia rhizophila CBS 207.26]
MLDCVPSIGIMSNEAKASNPPSSKNSRASAQQRPLQVSYATHLLIMLPSTLHLPIPFPQRFPTYSASPNHPMPLPEPQARTATLPHLSIYHYSSTLMKAPISPS